MLWDRGTWEPLVDDVAAALKKGDLKLRLDGVKLKGSWALIRTSGGDGRSWLLLKHRDEWAGPLDIAAFAPKSVKSGGYFTDIIEEQAPADLDQQPRGEERARRSDEDSRTRHRHRRGREKGAPASLRAGA